jgi:hypothetical protein
VQADSDDAVSLLSSPLAAVLAPFEIALTRRADVTAA